MDNVSKSTLYLTLLVGVFIVSMCLYLGHYAQPILDDFCFGYRVLRYDDAFDYVASTWQNLNGRWATSGIRYLFYKGVGLDSNYWLTVPLSIISIFLGFWFCFSSYVKCLKPRALLAILSAIVFLSISSKISSLVFWASSFLDYTLGYFVVYASLALVYSAHQKSSPHLDWRYYIAPLMVAISCGMSELFIIPIWAFVLGLFAFSVKRWFLLPVIIFMLIGTGFSLLAPGNTVRSGVVGVEFDFLKLIYETVLYGLRGLLLPSIALYLLSHVSFVKQILERAVVIVETDIPLLFRKLITLFAVLYPIAVIFVLELSLGAPGPGRAHNVSLFFLIFAWPIIISTLTFLKPRQYQKVFVNALMSLLGVVVLLGINNKDLIEDIASGEAASYKEFVLQAKAELSDPSNKGKDIVLTGPIKNPNISLGSEKLVTVDPSNWINRCVARYFGVKSVKYDSE